MCGVGVSEFHWPRRGLRAALIVLTPVLAGCSALPAMPSMPSWFSSSTGADANASAAPSLGLPADFECPSVQVRQGASTLTSSANPAEPTAMNLKYQVTISTTARECRMGPNNTVLLKVGMQGRVILGPEGGSPGSVDVPIRFAVVRETTLDSKVITTKLDRVAVALPPNDSNVLFTHVSEGLDFPMPRGGDIDNYLIYIGFDAVAAEPQRKKPAPKSKAKAVNRPTG
jgi:hypothetical protein